MSQEEIVSDKIITLPNIISFVRLLLIVPFYYLLLNDYNLGAAVLFAFAALTDCIDGFIARSTNSVSHFGKVLDPFVDRALMISAVIGLLLVGRLPLWIVVLVCLRDGIMLLGGSYLMKHYSFKPTVIFLGKVATTFLFTGFAFLLLNYPIVEGLGWVSVSWLPGLNASSCSIGMFLVYIGLILGLITTSCYFYRAYKFYMNSKKAA